MQDFKKSLEIRGLDRTIESVSPKRMLSYQIEREMARQSISRVDMAKRMNTSRAALNRLLDPENNSVTLQTIESAAAALGLTMTITMKNEDN